MKRTLVLYAMLSFTAAGAVLGLKPAAFGQSDHSFPASRPLGEVPLAARNIVVDADMPSGKQQKGVLLVLYDAVNHYYLWQFAATSDSGGLLANFRSGETAGYVDDKGLVLFFIVPGRLSAREYRSRADSLDSAVTAALREAADALPEYESGADVKAWRTTRLDTLGHEFWAPPGDARVGSAKVERVTRTGSGWTVIVRGQWVEEVELDADYQIRSGKRLTK